mgnify:CR=1 FL=1
MSELRQHNWLFVKNTYLVVDSVSPVLHLWGGVRYLYIKTMDTKIYTKTGDKGETSLLGGKRVSKSCLEMQVIGEVDELNAGLGVVVAHLSLLGGEKPTKQSQGMVVPSAEFSRHSAEESFLEMTDIIQFLQTIQCDLFKVGAELASLQSPLGDKISKIDNARVAEMEIWIDRFWGKLPELKNFILPGGSLAGAEIHRTRTICRRAERQLVDFTKKTSIRPELGTYINRLSDFLFALARWVNHTEEVEEIIV